MKKRDYGTCLNQAKNLKWNIDVELSNKISCFNREGAEPKM
jgi:hypothetical protein